MQSELRLAHYFSPVRGLHGVVITTIADCLPYADWRREGETFDRRAVSATWELMLSHSSSFRDLGISGDVGFTVESSEATLIFKKVEERFGLTYVFSSDAPLGVARLRVAMLEPVIAQLLEEHEPPVASASQARPKATPQATVRTSAAQASAMTTGSAAATTGNAASVPVPPAEIRVSDPVARQETRERPRPEPFSDIDEELAASEASDIAKDAAEAGDYVEAENDLDEHAQPESRSTSAVTPPGNGTPPVRRSFSRSVEPSTSTTNEPTSSAARGSTPAPIATEPSMGSRLLAYLERYAPDTHAALLRVSLQTGLPVTLLRQPDNLSADEFSQVAESVRNILGVEQLNL